uniref:Uncharacterized protein n=1 Tax=Nelumbo nucifera TaxID=4432 RepID=A0A822XCH4_NELNU|nr:TPA_asm: hypothetical protein HUJ06_020577 [Nelumbo nucifera]
MKFAKLRSRERKLFLRVSEHPTSLVIQSAADDILQIEVETDSPSGRVRKHKTTTMAPPLLLVSGGHLFSHRTPLSIESSILAGSGRVGESE